MSLNLPPQYIMSRIQLFQLKFFGDFKTCFCQIGRVGVNVVGCAINQDQFAFLLWFQIFCPKKGGVLLPVL